ncbi:MAG: phosphate ABC transporter ATP-binding protein [Streptosporangiales bacterium]|nr:phosphate ABC transporter ATP-binding protein [Streptosporangiales bacterium]
MSPHEDSNGSTPARRTPGGTRVEINGLTAYYGSRAAVTDVTLTVEPQSVHAFIGPSGCGKSTVLRAINRMHEEIPGARIEGTITIDGVDVYGPGVDATSVRRAVGMVFQKANPFPTMSIYDNVVAGLRLVGRNGRRKGGYDEVVERALRRTNLWDEVKDRLQKPGSALSGGQQQRLCIARAIAVEPEVVLMDEPCSALDPISTLAIEDLIAELKEQYTIIIVTHNMQQASRVSDVTAFFSVPGPGMPGTLIEVDDTKTMFQTPSQKATEDYITGRVG